MTRAALGTLFLLAAAPLSHAGRCGDTSDFAAAKAAVDAAAPCAGATTRGRYVKAAKRALGSRLRGACRAEFLDRFVKRSTCGRGRLVVCCKVDKKGRDRSRVLSEARCVRKVRGEPCTSTGAQNVGEGCSPLGTCVTTARTAPTTTTAPPGLVTTTTTVTVTTTSTTSTTICTNPPCSLDFTNGTNPGACGEIRDASAPIRPLGCGGLNIGGGGSTLLEGPTPDGSVSRFSIACSEGTCTVGPASVSPAPNTADPDCTDTGCRFGTPLPIPNPTVPMLSTCVVNTMSAAASGTLDLATGEAFLNVPLASQIYITGNAAQPCPRCSAGGSPASPGAGGCDGGARLGQPCTSTNSQGLTRDCPPDPSQSTGTITVDLSPLFTATADKTSPSGLYCNDQPPAQAGCFGRPNCRTIIETGAPAGLLATGVATDVTLVSAFCIPATGTADLDAAAGLPGPGAVSLTGTFTVR